MAACASKSSARLIQPAKSSIDSWRHTPMTTQHNDPTSQPEAELPPHRAGSSASGSFAQFNGCWQAQARQAEGSNSGSGGQVTHRAAAVHRLVLCAGDLSTAGGSAASSPCQVWRNPKSTLPETTHRFRRRAETFIHNTSPVLTGARRCYGCLPAYGQGNRSAEMRQPLIRKGNPREVVDPLMDTASKCPRRDRTRSSQTP